jgi:hypothetical protein
MTLISIAFLLVLGGLAVFVCVVFACLGISLMGRSQR